MRLSKLYVPAAKHTCAHCFQNDGKKKGAKVEFIRSMDSVIAEIESMGAGLIDEIIGAKKSGKEE